MNTPRPPLKITGRISIPADEIEFAAIRAQGAGGQHVNKVSSAVQLRFDAKTSRSLPDDWRRRLLAIADQRISSEGVIVIRAQRFRSQARNRAEALERLQELLRSAVSEPKRRMETAVPAARKRRRLEHKSHRGKLKRLRARMTAERD